VGGQDSQYAMPPGNGQGQEGELRKRRLRAPFLCPHCLTTYEVGAFSAACDRRIQNVRSLGIMPRWRRVLVAPPYAEIKCLLHGLAEIGKRRIVADFRGMDWTGLISGAWIGRVFCIGVDQWRIPAGFRKRRFLPKTPLFRNPLKSPDINTHGDAVDIPDQETLRNARRCRSIDGREEPGRPLRLRASNHDGLDAVQASWLPEVCAQGGWQAIANGPDRARLWSAGGPEYGSRRACSEAGRSKNALTAAVSNVASM
jgi:hypothetical protein